MKLRIKDWDTHFETAKSRTYDRSNKVCMPNKIGMGLAYILSEPDGASIFGNFVLLAEACSTQKKPREGYLTDTGRADGRAWSYQDISIRVRRPATEIQRCVEVCCNDKVGWIEDLEPNSVAAIPAVSAKYPLIERRGEEIRGDKDRAAHVSADADAAVPKPEYPPGFVKFWDSLPPQARDRSSRRECISEWKKQKLEQRVDSILAALEIWKQCRSWLDGFAPGAHRWLNKRKFDELPTTQGKSNGKSKPTAAERGQYAEPDTSMPIFGDKRRNVG